jgi:hypothetical protein
MSRAFGYKYVDLVNSTSASTRTLVGSITILDENNNTFLGENAGRSVTTGTNNLFYGTEAGRFVTTGSENAYVGIFAGYAGGGGDDNTYVGNRCGQYAEGNGNVGVGLECLQGGSANAKLTGSENVAIGVRAGEAVTVGERNVFMGYECGLITSTGSSNVFTGTSCGKYANTSESVAVGFECLLGDAATPVSGVGNTAMGRGCGKLLQGGTDNVMIGRNCGETVTNTSDSVFVGTDAGRYVDADESVAIGKSALRGVSETSQVTGGNNVAVGLDCLRGGLGTKSGESNVAIGNQAGAGFTTMSNACLLVIRRVKP